MNILDHYKMLWFFNFHRFEGDNYQNMRSYFARLFIYEIEEHLSLWDKRVLDVGGSTGEFCQTLNRERNCDAVNLDPNPGDYVWPHTIVGHAEKIPFDANDFDLVICRGVLEHIPDDYQQKSMDEMHRVTKYGGICYVVIPPWYNPHAGHQLKPFHLLPFAAAKYLRELIFRKEVHGNSLEEINLYKITFRKMLTMIQASGFQLIGTRDIHFRLHALTRVPLVREILVPAVSFILVKVR